MTTATLDETDYIIGTTDAEIDRLGFQHGLWREAALAAWRKAGIKPGMTVMDVGCGPGFASFDLARLVGPSGRVIAVDQSPKFLRALEAGAKHRGLANIETVESGLADYDWPTAQCDAIWSRWCLCFLPEPEQTLTGIDKALKPGGLFVTQEYVDYRSFQFAPSTPIFERFREAVQESWDKYDGDPCVAMKFPAAFARLNWDIEDMMPIMHAARPGDVMWDWPITWLSQAPDRLIELGFFTEAEAAEFRAYIEVRKTDPNTLLMTPMVLEMRARKPE